MIAVMLFCIGLYGVLTRKDMIAVLACVEIMLGAAIVMLVGLSGSFLAAQETGWIYGSVEAASVLLMVITAAAAAVGLALLVALARKIGRTRVDELTEVRDHR